MQTVRIRKQKRPAGQMMWRAYLFTVDEFGTWLYSPEGTLVRGDPLFDDIGWQHLAAARRLSLPPLRNLP